MKVCLIPSNLTSNTSGRRQIRVWLEKSIYFYRIYDKDTKFIHKLRKVCTLQEGEREYKHKDVTLNIRSQQIEINDQQIITGTIRLLRDTAPSIGTLGTNQSKPISLKENEGVNEKTHFTIMTLDNEKSYIAMEYNHYGPKISLLFNLVNDLFAKEFDSDSEKNSYIYLTKRGALLRIKMNRVSTCFAVRFTKKNTHPCDGHFSW